MIKDNFINKKFIILKLTRGILVTTVAAHIIIMMIKSALGLPSMIGFWHGLAASFLYSAIMITSQTISHFVTTKSFAINTKFNVIVHILVQSSVALLSFKLAQLIEKLIFGYCNIPDSSLYVIISVAMFLSLIWNTSYYLHLFYQQLQQANNAILESELKALKAQINPHFLFNTLNSIAALITINPKEAENVTVQLADLFRYSLKASKTTWITLKEEVEAINLYLYIEKIRFQERLVIRITQEDKCDDVIIPSLLILPLVENTIKHGANKVEFVFEVDISLKLENNNLICIVSDNGPGFDTSLGDAIFQKGTGLSNIKERLELLYNKKAKIIINQNSVTLILPIENSRLQSLIKIKHQ